MTPFMSLLLPIVLSAVAVFIVSMIVHMAMPWHKSDYGNVPNDDAAIAAIQSLNLAPDDYAVPNPRLPGGGKNPNFIANFERGPSFHMTVIPPGGMNMGKLTGTWFGFMLLISAIAGWVTGSIVAPGGSEVICVMAGGVLHAAIAAATAQPNPSLINPRTAALCG